MKLRSLHIEKYKMFKDFDISFVDEKDKALPIVVLAGVNGSGKTTLLEFIEKFISKGKIELIVENTIKLVNLEYLLRYSDKNGVELRKEQVEIDKYIKNIVYFSFGVDDIKKVEKEFVKYWYNQVKFHNKRNDEITESLQKFIKESFEGLDLNFTYSHIDADDNIFFQNENEKFKMSELSTGEQTLLSKVLYLFLKEYEDKVILIDEPELSLHPSWQNRVLKIYKNFAEKNECQIIIATHSPHIIASAENRYIRFLEKDDVGNVTAMNDIQAYGRDIEWVLQEMGVKNLRVSDVLEQFTKCQQLLNDEKYDEAEECIDALEEEIGQNDRQIMNLKNSLFFERD